jgi:hypothetical protein
VLFTLTKGQPFGGILRRMPSTNADRFSPSALALAHRRTSSRSINNLASSVVGVCRPFKINQPQFWSRSLNAVGSTSYFFVPEATSTQVSFVLSIDDTTTSIGHTIRLIWMSAIPFIVLLRTSRSPSIYLEARAGALRDAARRLDTGACSGLSQQSSGRSGGNITVPPAVNTEGAEVKNAAT